MTSIIFSTQFSAYLALKSFGMKSIFTALLALCSIHFVMAQYCGSPSSCTPVGPATQQGLYPSFFQQPPLINGQSVAINLGFLNYDTIGFSGQTLTMDS
jgi:hypothetical protein